MDKPVPENALILVADGRKANVFRNIGVGTKLELREEQRLTQKDFVGDGPSGVSPEEQSPNETNEATFAKKVVKMLEKLHSQNDFEAVVLVADPQTLGQLRNAMHKNLEKAIVLSLSKDYTNHSIAEITKALS